MVSTHVDIDKAEWTPGTAFYGPTALDEGKEIVQLKILSDRRQQGGGIAWLAKFSPPPGKLIKIVATALSDEHVFNLEGGRATKAGTPVRSAGGYTLNPTGQPHSALIATETVASSSIPASRTRSCRWRWLISRDKRSCRRAS